MLQKHYKDTDQAIRKNVDGDDKIRSFCGTGQLKTYINEPGVYSLIFGSKKPEAKLFKKWVVKEVLTAIRKTGGYSLKKYPKSIAFKIENEFDLHTKVVSYMRKFYPNALISAGLGELQDTKEKRISSWAKGYTKGQPDIIIHNYHKYYTGFVLEFKTALGCGITAEVQEKFSEKYKENGYKTLISNDYDIIIREINNYFQNVRIKCNYCRRGFISKFSLNRHEIFFHKITFE